MFVFLLPSLVLGNGILQHFDNFIDVRAILGLEHMASLDDIYQLSLGI